MCVAHVAAPLSLHCGVPVGEQRWETSAWLGWTGPSAGLIASPHTPAATHTHTRTRKASERLCEINRVVIKRHPSK